MSDASVTSICYFNGQWATGPVPLMTSTTNAAWLANTVFDGARAFEGVAPDLDLHCQRAIRSAQGLHMRPAVTAAQVEALAREGIAPVPGRHPALHPSDVLGRERDGAARSRVDAVRAGDHQDEPARSGQGLLGVPVHLSPAEPRAGPDPRQGGVPVSAGRPGHRPGEGARLRQRGDVRSDRQRRRADRAERHVRQGRRVPDADPQRHVPERASPGSGSSGCCATPASPWWSGPSARTNCSPPTRSSRPATTARSCRACATSRGRSRPGRSTARRASCTGPSPTAGSTRRPRRVELSRSPGSEADSRPDHHRQRPALALAVDVAQAFFDQPVDVGQPAHEAQLRLGHQLERADADQHAAGRAEAEGPRFLEELAVLGDQARVSAGGTSRNRPLMSPKRLSPTR